ncbi:acyl-CoA dehydrogenase family protein [Shimia thalassica]|uniref:acyl-CoA dehydrogenase family protein n=1 Tax=Shimia thalassica TaxID=1715693 RepID=UPI0026E3BE5B|nr:acyl-CoA dehydrogenase family protein [Shimia thalassica]MDO6481728.1 acyl-CoA dehydrogenase family protein [Shimia thalassica]
MLHRPLFEPEHEMFRDSVRKWAEAEVVPHFEEWQQAGIVSREVWKSAGEQGFLAMYAEEEYGGLGMDDYRFDQILIEELTWREAGLFIPLHNRVVGPYFRKFANDEQKARFFPGIVDGSNILAIAITEPGTGSDVAGMRSRAEDRGDHWLLNGAKTYISNGILADTVIVAARTDPDNPYALGLFLVERDMPGFKRGRKLAKLGLHSQDTAELFFEDVKVPKENVLGDPAHGFKSMMVGLAEERLTGAVSYVARAERSFEITLEYVKDRNAFGRPIGAFQNTRFKMAEMRTQLDAAWVFVDHCTSLHLKGNLSAELAAQAKLMTSETEGRVVDECLQLHGGAGYMEEYEISRHYADARISRIYAGTSEIMKEIIGRSLGLDERGVK